MPVRVLSVNHGPSVPGGVFDEAVQAAGTTPDSAESYGAVMVFGGSMHPDQDDRFRWLASEEEFLRDVLSARIPVFGVCLGAQMLARAAGGTVKPASAPEIGWLDVSLTPAGTNDAVLRELPPTATVFQWHHYTLEVPPGGTELARSEACTHAFRLADQPAWGIQFHAEVTLPMLTAWTVEDPDELPISPAELLVESERAIEQSNAQGRALADAFLREASS